MNTQTFLNFVPLNVPPQEFSRITNNEQDILPNEISKEEEWAKQ